MDPFFLKLLLSFVIGGTWITLATLLAEKFGSKLGGLLAGLPSTVVVALFFIGWTQGVKQAFDAASVIPLAVGLNSLFAITYAAATLRTGLLLGIVASLMVWFLAQALSVSLDIQSFGWRIAGGAAIVSLGYCVLEHGFAIPSRGHVSGRPHTAWQVLGRGIISGGMIALAVIMSKVGGAVLGGIFSCFPAVFSSTLIIAANAVDMDFSRALVKPLAISTIVNPAVFAIAFRVTVLQAGLIGATVIAYGVSLVSVYLTYLFIKHNVT